MLYQCILIEMLWIQSRLSAMSGLGQCICSSADSALFEGIADLQMQEDQGTLLEEYGCNGSLRLGKWATGSVEDLRGYSCFRGAHDLPMATKSARRQGAGSTFMALTIPSAFLWHLTDLAGGVQSGELLNKKCSPAAPRHCQNMAFPLAQPAQ